MPPPTCRLSSRMRGKTSWSGMRLPKPWELCRTKQAYHYWRYIYTTPPKSFSRPANWQSPGSNGNLLKRRRKRPYTLALSPPSTQLLHFQLPPTIPSRSEISEPSSVIKASPSSQDTEPCFACETSELQGQLTRWPAALTIPQHCSGTRLHMYLANYQIRIPFLLFKRSSATPAKRPWFATRLPRLWEALPRTMFSQSFRGSSKTRREWCGKVPLWPSTVRLVTSPLLTKCTSLLGRMRWVVLY